MIAYSTHIPRTIIRSERLFSLMGVVPYHEKRYPAYFHDRTAVCHPVCQKHIYQFPFPCISYCTLPAFMKNRSLV